MKYDWSIFYFNVEDLNHSCLYATKKHRHPKRFKTTLRFKRYYPGEQGFFANLFKQSTDNFFNMSHIPMPREDFTGAPIVQEPDDIANNGNALVSLAKAPLNLIMQNGVQSFLGSNWKSTLITQSANATAMMLAQHYGWKTSGPTIKILSSLVVRYFAGTLIINPITNPIGFLTLAYDAYYAGALVGQTVNTVNSGINKVKSIYNMGAGWASWFTNLFYKTAGTTKNVARISGGDTSQLALESTNQALTLKQYIVNGTPKQFTSENFEILQSFQPKLNPTNFNRLSDALAYKSNFTDKLAQRYMNLTTDSVNVNQLVNTNTPIINNASLNTTNPQIIGEYSNNVQGQEAIKLAENLMKTQQQTVNMIPNTIENVVNETATEVVRELSFAGKLAIFTAGVIACIFSYRILNDKFPNYVNLDWIYPLKDKIYNFFFPIKNPVNPEKNVMYEVNTNGNQINNTTVPNHLYQTNPSPLVQTLNNEDASSYMHVESADESYSDDLANDNPPSYQEVVNQQPQYIVLYQSNPPIIPVVNTNLHYVPYNPNQIISSNEVNQFAQNINMFNE